MPTPADELKAAAEKLRKLAASLPTEDWGNRPWQAEECVKSCACIVSQGAYQDDYRKPQDPPMQYVADAETPEHASYIATMHPGVGAALAPLLERQARIAAETQDFLGDEFQDGALDQNVHDALAVARQILGSTP